MCWWYDVNTSWTFTQWKVNYFAIRFTDSQTVNNHITNTPEIKNILVVY